MAVHELAVTPVLARAVIILVAMFDLVIVGHADNIMNFLKQNWFKLLAGLVLLGAIGHHPYSYFQFTRWIVTISGAYLAYFYHQHKRSGWMFIFIAIAILFNPIAPFYMSASSWHVYDLIAAVIFFISVFEKRLRRD